MYHANTPLTKPRLWQKIVLQESGDYSDLYEIFNELIDPRMIFLDKCLKDDEIQICKYG